MDATSAANENRWNYCDIQFIADHLLFRGITCGIVTELQLYQNVNSVLTNTWFLFVFFCPQIICYIFIVNTKFSILCQPISYKTDRISLFEAYLTYGYFFLKFNHFLDTVFFILRKKSSQVTFLHVYHHIVAVIGAYIGVLFVPGLCLSVQHTWKFRIRFSLTILVIYFQVVIASSLGW